MLEIRVQKKAQDDLENIWRYTFNRWGEEQADKYFSELQIKFETLKEHPFLGSACDYIRAGYRQFQINKHLVFYVVSEGHVQIIRVLHHAMDFKDHIE